MAEANNAPFYECSFCWKKNEDMEDPRELPCGDVGCRRCLIGWMEGYDGELLCTRCYVMHGQVDVDSLKKIGIGYGVAALECTGFDCHVTSVKYCVTCDRMYCGTHLQAHDSIYGPNHQMITIKEYQQSPDKYLKVPCEHHAQEVLIEACIKCSKLTCKRCDRLTDCTDLQHEFKPLSDVAGKITCDFEELMKLSNARRLEHLGTEKEVWKKLDVVDGECRKWMREIERVRDAQIKEINEECEKVRQKVEKYLKEAVEMVEKFAAEMLVVKDSLDISCARVSQLMKKGHMTEKIKQKDRMTEEMTRNIGAEVAGCEPTKNISLIVRERSMRFNVELINLPSSLSLRSEHDTNGGCYSATHRADGDVLVGCHGGVYVLNTDSKNMKRCRLEYELVFGVIEHGQAVYVLHQSGDKRKVEICLPNMEKAETLFKFTNAAHCASYFSVSDEHIIVYSGERPDGTRQLILYNKASQQKKTLSITSPYRPYFLPSGELLAAGIHQLIKYRIENENLTKIWTRNLQDVGRVCAGSKGMIFASTRDNRRSIYILSPSGELMREISHEKLPAQLTGRISVRGDELVVSGWFDKILIFKINY